jgi:hypothetical protein
LQNCAQSFTFTAFLKRISAPKAAKHFILQFCDSFLGRFDLSAYLLDTSMNSFFLRSLFSTNRFILENPTAILVQGDQIERIFAYRAQGDQIGRIFARWVIVYFGQFYKFYRRNPKIWPTFSLNIDNVLILTKKLAGLRLGDFLHKLIWSP